MACARSQVELVGVKSEQPPQWGWFVALGAVLLVLGLFAGANLVAATAATVFYVGVPLTAAAALLIVHAFPGEKLGRLFLLEYQRRSLCDRRGDHIGQSSAFGLVAHAFSGHRACDFGHYAHRIKLSTRTAFRLGLAHSLPSWAPYSSWDDR